MEEDEIVAALEANPDLRTGVFNKVETNFTKHLTEGKGMTLLTKEQSTAHQKAVADAVRDNHTGYETKIAKLTGIQKNAGESGHDYFDRVSKNLKYIADGDTPESALVKGLQTELNTLKTNLATEKANTFKATVRGNIESAVGKLTFVVPIHVKTDAAVAEYQRNKQEQAALVFAGKYTAKADETTGKIVYVNGKGEAQTENGEPMTADQIAARDFAFEMAPKGHSQGGAGSHSSDPNSTNEGYLAATPEAIIKKLSELGKEYMSPEWEEMYRKAMKAIGKGL